MSELQRHTLAALLTELEQELARATLWQARPPAPEAFESTLPFAADRMALHEWLQWVLIARFRALLDGRLPLPETCAVAPMAEESMKEQGATAAPIIAVLVRIDALFRAPS